MIFGADVSEYQGAPDIDALAGFVATGKFSFFMLRTEDGAHQDARFNAYCMAFKAVRFFDLGTYFFFRAHLPVRSQCQRAVDMHGDLPGPLAVDMETLDGVTPELAAEATIEALETVTALSGRKPLLYTDAGDWGRLGAYGRQHAFAGYPLWLAAVTEDPNHVVTPPPGLGEVVMRQYTWKSRVPGFSGNVDGDVFLGSLEEWRAVGRAL